MLEQKFSTTNNLPFEVAQHQLYALGGHQLFRVGTCEGQWGSTWDSYYILSVINSDQNNGHLTDVFEWFEFSCKRDNRNLLVLECMNDQFYDHLINKRGFVALDKGKKNLIKIFNQNNYQKLLKKGNRILIKHTMECV